MNPQTPGAVGKLLIASHQALHVPRKRNSPKAPSSQLCKSPDKVLIGLISECPERSLVKIKQEVRSGWGGVSHEPTQAQGLCGHSQRGRLSSHPNQHPSDGKAWLNPTFFPKLLYSCSFTQCWEKSHCYVKKAAGWKERERGTVNCEDILKISLSTGNALHHPLGPSQSLSPPTPPKYKDLCSGKRLEGYQCEFQPAIGGIKKGAMISQKSSVACWRV